MNRRRLLASIGTLASTTGSVGCLDSSDSPGAGMGDGTAGSDGSDDDLPETCPVNTLEDHDPPAEADREAVEAFVAEYESAYIEETEIDRDRYERVEGPGTRIEETTAMDDGYALEVGTGWATWEPDRHAVEFRRVDGADDEGDVDSVSLDHVALEDNDHLREAIETVVDEDQRVEIPEGHPEYPQIRTDIESAAGTVDGALIEHADELVEVTETTVPGVHGDHFETAAYYVAPGVVYRAPDPQADCRDGEVVEC